MFNNPSFNKMQMNRKVVKLFEPGGMYEESAWFSFEHQATIQATSLGPDDYIEFDVLHINGGEWPQYCNCDKTPGEMPYVDSYSTLTCPTCESDGNEAVRTTIKLTASSPVVVLNSPQNAAIRARYTGNNIEFISVWATLETNADNSDMFNGCGEVCKVQKTRTGNIRCNVETDTQEYELIDNYGVITWSDPVPLQWEMTGRVAYADEANPSLDNVKAEYVDPCGDFKWEVTPFKWTPTSEFVCVDVTEDSDDYNILRKYKNEYGTELWYKDSVEQWADTGLTRCENNIVEKQQTTLCGDVRWFKTEETCGYLATYKLDSGGWAYRPGQQDPEATVALEDCEGSVVAYIYPEPREGAKTPVTAGCTACAEGGEVLGYAVDSNAPIISMPKQSNLRVVSGGLDYLPELVIKKIPDIAIKNLEQKVFDGVVKELPTVEAEIKNKVSISVDSLPVVAVSTFEKDGEIYVMWSDGVYTKVNAVDAGPYKVFYMLNGMIVAGDAPTDENEYEGGSVVYAKEWNKDNIPDGLVLLGYSLTPEGPVWKKEGDRFNISSNVSLYPKWLCQLAYSSGTTDKVEGLKEPKMYNAGSTVKVSSTTPRRENYVFSHYLSSDGERVMPGDTVTLDSPVVLRAFWKDED